MDEFVRDLGEWLPALEETFPPKLTGDMLFDAVNAKSPCASGFDGSAWNDFRARPIGRF